jgi:hypothetical protein
MDEVCRATIAVGDSKITFEGSASFVQAQVEKFAGAQQGTVAVSATGHHSAPISTEKQLIAEKRPRGHHEVVTVLAFALTESGTKEFTEDDVRRAYIRADVRPPKYVSQALRDAKNKFEYVTSGSKRGTYRLTNHGDRTVRFDLPRAS